MGLIIAKVVEIIGQSNSLISLLLLDLIVLLFQWDIVQKDGSYTGFDIDLATAVFEYYGIMVHL